MMKWKAALAVSALGIVAALAWVSYGISQPTSQGRAQVALAQGAGAGKCAYLLFYRTWDGAATAMAHTLKTHAENHSTQTLWTSVNIADPAERAVVDRFQLSRAPMPLLLAVHANGAVMGAFVGKVSDADLAGSLASPLQAECIKLLQQNQIVCLCVNSGPQQNVPPGVRQFQADPHYASRTRIVTAQLGDPRETNFYKNLKLDARSAPTTVLFAPPGVVVGAFPASASMSDLAKALHAAGKCCNDPNCKHNHH